MMGVIAENDVDGITLADSPRGVIITRRPARELATGRRIVCFEATSREISSLQRLANRVASYGNLWPMPPIEAGDGDDGWWMRWCEDESR